MEMLKKNFLFQIVILGPDGAGKTTLINNLKKTIVVGTNEVEIIHLKPSITKKKRNIKIVSDPHKLPPRSAVASIIKISLWFFLYWYKYLCFHKNGIVVRIWDRYFHDIIIDPLRYRYGAPLCVAELIGKIIPKPDMWVLIDAPPEVIHRRKQEVSMEETMRQRLAYHRYMKSVKNAFIIDACQPIGKTVDDMSKLTSNVMAQRIKKRFDS